MGQRGIAMIPQKVSQGGLGVQAVAQNALLLGNGQNPVVAQTLPAAKQVLRGNSLLALQAKPEGKILQVQNFVNATLFTQTSGWFPMWSFSITTVRDNSKVLFLGSQNTGRSGGVNAYGGFKLYRFCANPSFAGDVYFWGFPCCFYDSGADLEIGPVQGMYLDAPGAPANTTVTYTVWVNNAANQGQFHCNLNGNVSTALLMEVAA